MVFINKKRISLSISLIYALFGGGIMKQIISVLFLLLFILSSCSNQIDETNEGTQIPNPAAVYCEQQGGTIRIEMDETGGQRGICILTDGMECDEWAYYRGECP
jgi:putative hemolysin